MFKINKHNTRENSFWLNMMDTKSSIIITYVKEHNIVDLRVFNEYTVYNRDFEAHNKYIVSELKIPIENNDVSFNGLLSPDGNEYDIDIIYNQKKLTLNLYYNLGNALVISITEDGRRTEITTIPEALLN